jgi:hypothetical protein
MPASPRSNAHQAYIEELPMHRQIHKPYSVRCHRCGTMRELGDDHVCQPGTEEDWRKVTEKQIPRPDKTLGLLGDLYRDRNAAYGDSYLTFGPVMEAMFPDGLVLRSAEDWNRFALLFLTQMKLHRYAMRFHDGGQRDSLDDISVYAQMLRHVDALGKEEAGK